MDIYGNENRNDYAKPEAPAQPVQSAPPQTYDVPPVQPAPPQSYYAPPQRTPKKKSKALPVIGAVLGAVILLVGVLSLLGAAQKPKTANMTDTPCDDVSTLTDYYIDVLVVDYVGTNSMDDRDLEDYFLGMFLDGEGKCWYCAIRAEQDSPVYQTLNDYAMDDGMLIGDLRLKGYFDVTTVSATAGLKDSLDETIEIYDDIMRGTFDNLGRSDYTVEFLAETEDAYLAAQKAKNRSAVFGGILFAVIGIGLLAPSAMKIRKINAENRDLAAAVPYGPQADVPYAERTAYPPQQTYPPQAPQNPYAPPQNPYAPPQAAPVPDETPTDFGGGNDPV